MFRQGPVLPGGYKQDLYERLNNLFLTRIKISHDNDLKGFEGNLALYNMKHTIVMLISNELKNPNGYMAKVKTYRTIRKTELAIDAYKNVSPMVIPSKIKYMALLLKYRLYYLLAIF